MITPAMELVAIDNRASIAMIQRLFDSGRGVGRGVQPQ